MKTKTSIYVEQKLWREFRAECIRKGLKPSGELEKFLRKWLKKR